MPHDSDTLVPAITLTDAQIDAIAEKAATKAVARMTDHIYQQVGKSIISKIFWLAGACAIGTYFYLQSKGFIK